MRAYYLKGKVNFFTKFGQNIPFSDLILCLPNMSICSWFLAYKQTYWLRKVTCIVTMAVLCLLGLSTCMQNQQSEEKARR